LVWGILWVPIFVLLLPFLLPIVFAPDVPGFGNKEKIEDKEFRVWQQYSFIPAQSSWKGYLFFPRGSYSTLEVTAGAIDDWAAAINQIEQGESPTLRHTETIRCSWPQQ
jgi:hypothetical protein